MTKSETRKLLEMALTTSEIPAVTTSIEHAKRGCWIQAVAALLHHTAGRVDCRNSHARLLKIMERLSGADLGEILEAKRNLLGFYEAWAFGRAYRYHEASDTMIILEEADAE